MLKLCRLMTAFLLIAFSYVAHLHADPLEGVINLSEPGINMLADNSGNPWALPAPVEPYVEPYNGQPHQYQSPQSHPSFQGGQHFITPEELNSIYKDKDKYKHKQDSDKPGNRYARPYYAPGDTFDPMLPGAVYPGVGGGVYNPYGLSPFYTPYNFNSVAPFIY